ncbi:MAG: bifunctional precorrin-2 dehydrogenase/sirohydrochlorin ferrochelatase [Bacteroidales bacterium]|jgi:siroheme synthase-like protein|nr:bifunctional precorrin-2 dehydrogenase/sirohydrochlorin ferrochelatase [Bacteroidales bacterium]
MTFLPISINISDKRILLIGGGHVAFHKASVLQRFTDDAIVISPAFLDGFDALPFRLVRKEYAPEDLEGAFLVYICTENATLNEKIKAECAKRGILASVCDHPALCDFISPAVWKSGNMTVAVSSNAQNVRQSIALRDKIGQIIDNE